MASLPQTDLAHQSLEPFDFGSWMADKASLGRLLRLNVLLTFFLIVLGSGVRATESGMACPDWPLCFGELVPSFDFHIFMEWFHRAVAGLLSLSVLWASIVLLRQRELRAKMKWQVVVAGVLLLIQIVLGGLTVLQFVEPKTVAAHLTNAVAFFGLLVWIDGDFRGAPKISVPRSLSMITSALIVLLGLQIAVGGMVSANYAAYVCQGFPSCNGSEWFPSTLFPVVLHMSHRIFGFFLVALTIFGLFLAKKSANVYFQSYLGLASLMGVQVGLGVINVLFQVPLWATVFHLANAVFMLGFAVWIRIGMQSPRAVPHKRMLERPV